MDRDDDEALVAAVARWRNRGKHALLIVDQFEELFTLNALTEQVRFSALLEQLALNTNVHVLLSLRDDFLAQCNAHEPLRPIFHELTVFDPPAGANLRRALVQPAMRCGYRFEDDGLVDGMLGEVEGERGALPLLAFAAVGATRPVERPADPGDLRSGRWRRRRPRAPRRGDHRPHRRWQGAAGPGAFPQPHHCRRHTCGARGRRAAVGIPRDRSRGGRRDLGELVDARLLTTCEIHDDDRDPTRRLEIIHESLLANWSEQTFDLRNAQWSGTYDGEYLGGVWTLQFTPDGRLLTAGSGGVRLWDLATGEAEWLVRTVGERCMFMAADRTGRYMLTADTVPTPRGGEPVESLTFHDRRTGSSRAIASHGARIGGWFALDPTGAIMVTSVPVEGVLQVGSTDGSEPHLLFARGSDVSTIAISPDSRWIASGHKDGTIRLWPMPDVSKPPLHTLPHDELIAKLKTFTNLRVVRDETSHDDWKVEVTPFPGWKTVPKWQ